MRAPPGAELVAKLRGPGGVPRSAALSPSLLVCLEIAQLLEMAPVAVYLHTKDDLLRVANRKDARIADQLSGHITDFITLKNVKNTFLTC